MNPAYTLPMFPLGSTLLPGAAIPLRVFEPRFLALVDHCLDVDHPRHDPVRAGEFGVVMIERGREVGGGDIRAMVGTVARIVDIRSGADRHHLLAVGTRRIRVVEWLPDEPYPLASVEDWPDGSESGAEDGAGVGIAELLLEARRLVGLAVELGDLPSSVMEQIPEELSPDVGWATYQLASIVPLGSADRHRILCGPDPDDRLAILRSALDDLAMSLRFRLQR